VVVRVALEHDEIVDARRSNSAGIVFWNKPGRLSPLHAAKEKGGLKARPWS
jgi:hypothetical protein